MQEELSAVRRALAGWLVIVAAAAPAALADHREIVQASLGPAGGNSGEVAYYGGMTADGGSIYFDTVEPLIAEDTDSLVDTYVRTGDTTSLVSQVEEAAPPLGDAGAGFLGASADGSTVVLTSNSIMAPNDPDTSTDIYVRTGGHTILVTNKDDAFGPLIGTPAYRGMSADGNLIVFQTLWALSTADQDGTRADLYSFNVSTGQLKLLSRGSGTPNERADASAPFGQAMTGDGTSAFFETWAQLTAGDTDSASDIYRRTGSSTTLVTNIETASPQDMTYQALTPDGSHVWFSTAEPLDVQDTDDKIDVYRWDSADESIHLMSVGPQAGVADDADFQAVSADGSRVWWTTYEQLTSGDTDAFSDIYERVGDDPATLESVGPAGGNAGPDDQVFSGVSADGLHMYFRTHERLTADDTDAGANDVYERFGGTTTRVSVGAQNDSSPYDASFAGAAGDGSRVLFQTDGKFAAADTDAEDDFYLREAGATTLLTGGTRDLPAVYGGVSADAKVLAFRSMEHLAATDTDVDDAANSCTGPGLPDGCDVFVSRVNRVSVVTATGSALACTAGGSPVVLDPGLTVDDPDSPALAGATVTLTGGAGTLAFTDQGPITGAVSGGGATLTLSGSATPAEYQSALRTVTVACAGPAGARTAAFSVTDGAEDSAEATRPVDVAAAPAPPTPPAPDGGEPARSFDVGPFGGAPAFTFDDRKPAPPAEPERARPPAIDITAAAGVVLRRLRTRGLPLRLQATDDVVVRVELRTPDGRRVTFAHTEALHAGEPLSLRLSLTRSGARLLRGHVHRNLRLAALDASGAGELAGRDVYLRHG